MKLPADVAKRHEYYTGVRRICDEQNAQRRAFYDRLSTWALQGSDTLEPARQNILIEQIKESTADLFAINAAQFGVDFPPQEGDNWLDEAEAMAADFTHDWKTSEAGLEIALGVEWGHIWPTSIFKLYVDRNRPALTLVHPADISVLRPKVRNWRQQEAICHTYTQDLSAFERSVRRHPDYRAIMTDALRVSAPESVRAGSGSGLPPAYRTIMLSQTSPNMIGSPVGGILGSGAWDFMQQSREPVVWLSEMWIMDDDAGDYRVVREMIHTERIISEYLNPLVPEQHCFFPLTLDPNPFSIWGTPIIARLLRMQLMHEEFLGWISYVLQLQFDPPLAATGVSGILEEKLETLRRPGGTYTNPMPQGDVKNMAPPMPPDAFGMIEELKTAIAKNAGRPSQMMGVGAPGARSGEQTMAQAMLAAGPSINQAMRVQLCVERIATYWMKVKAMCSGLPLVKSDGTKFLGTQVPQSYNVLVNANSTSPAFAQANLEKVVFASTKGAIPNEDLPDYLNLPMPRRARALARKMAAAQAEVAKRQLEMEEAKTQAKLETARRP